MNRADREPEPGDSAVGEEAESLRRALDEEKQRGLRLLADFDNLRRRVARETAAAKLEGRRGALLPLLAVLDTIERALATGSTDAEFHRGVEAIHRQFLTALREAGATRIATVGEPVDPAVHEVVATLPDDGAQPGIILREARSGWQLGDELLRPAQVVVSPGESEPLWP